MKKIDITTPYKGLSKFYFEKIIDTIITEGDLLDLAVQQVLDDGLRTKDIMSAGKKEVGTSEMGNGIIHYLNKIK